MRRFRVLLPVLTALALAAGCAMQPAVSFSSAEIATIVSLSSRAALSIDPGNRVADNADAARLGRTLFFDRRLSRDGTMACATCHDPAKQWGDGRPLPVGAPDYRPRHTPSLWNVALNRWFFWDGRADSLWAQSLQPLENPSEMNSSRAAVVATIAGDPTLRRDYEAIFGSLPASGAKSSELDRAFANVGKAIAAFERTIVTGDAPFDRFARALRKGAEIPTYPAAAQRGLKLFVGRGGCINCHHGGELTDREFHNIGLTDDTGIFNDPGRFDGIRLVRQDPFNAAGPFTDHRAESATFGLRHLAERQEAWGEFKTPTLRNIAKTAPYMHDGRFATLADVLDFYSTLKGAVVTGADRQHLKPLNLDQRERDDLTAFLETLTAEDPPK
jgi:cytochrome c peroxidase